MDLSANDRLERSQWDFFWLPDDTEVIDRPELAVVRSPRPVSFLNCVTRTRAPVAALPALVDEVLAFHGPSPSRWLLPDTFDTAPLETALAGAGYAQGGFHEARCIRPADYRPRPDAGLEVRPVRTLETLRHCVEVTRVAFGQDDPLTEAQLRAELAQCAEPDGRVQRFVVYDGETPVSSGGFNWFPDLCFALLWAGATVPEARGRGAYSALLATRIALAHALGAEWVGLYAVHDTSAPIVARQGFERVGEMTYWDRAAGR